MARTITTIECTVEAAPAITKPPSAETFPSEAQAFMDWAVVAPEQFATFATTANAAGADLSAIAEDVADASDAAVTSASAALQSAAAALTASQEASSFLVTPAWDVATSYSYPQTVTGSNGHTYRCIGQSVVGSDPVSSGLLWTNISIGLKRTKLLYLSQS